MSDKNETTNLRAAESAAQSKQPVYTTGGHAQVDINRPLAVTFATLTNANLWPQINKGVSKDIAPPNVILAKGVRFTESITSPSPGVNDWANEWLVESFEPNKRMVISGRDNFSSVEIHSRLTYEFTAKDERTTTFRRGIEVSLDLHFLQNASKAEIDALFSFLGAQWLMADHLKRYMESNTSH